MSIATDKARLDAAKADLKAFLEDNSVTVPADTKIDGLVELLADVETGGGVKINAITASELPATVTDGQIVVITDTAAGTIYVDTDEPASPVNGDVWVQVGSSNYGVEFSETFRNGLVWAVQYNGNTWGAVTGYVGEPNGWKVFTIRLPEEYQEIEYIESTGNQYINTAFAPNQGTRLVCDVYFAKTSTTSFLFGSRGSGNSLWYNFLCTATGFRSDFYNDTTTFSHAGGRMLIDKNRNVTTINGTTVRTSTNGNFALSNPMYLFGENNAGTFYGGCSAKIYSLRIYSNDILVRDFIPCYRKADNVAGLYDLSTANFYTNAGSGSFIVGAAISPEAEQLQIIDILTGEVE